MTIKSFIERYKRGRELKKHINSKLKEAHKRYKRDRSFLKANDLV